MTPLLQVVSLGHDLKSVCVVGDGKKKYLSYPNTKLYKINVRETLLIRFGSEQEGKDFIQNMIDERIPFLDAERTYAYFDVMDMINEGKLKGKPVRSTWKDGEYIVHG